MAEIEYVSNVETECDSKLGSPSVSNCVAAAVRFGQTTAVGLNPQDGPLIKISGKSLPGKHLAPSYELKSGRQSA